MMFLFMPNLILVSCQVREDQRQALLAAKHARRERHEELNANWLADQGIARLASPSRRGGAPTFWFRALEEFAPGLR